MARHLAALAAAVCALTATASRVHKQPAEAALPPFNSVVTLLTSQNLGFRHCNYVGYATPAADGGQTPEDFSFVIKPALNGAPLPAVSLQSLNYDTKYVAPNPVAGTEATRVGIVSNPLPDDASWTVVAGLGGGNYSLQSLSKNASYAGLYLTQTATLSGSCSGQYNAPSGDVILAPSGSGVTQTFNLTTPPPPPPPSPMTLSIAAAEVDHAINPSYFGCHTDPGYAEEPLTWSPSMVFGNSFESPPIVKVYAWSNVTSPANGAAVLDPAITPVNPNLPTAPSLKLTSTGGSGVVGWANGGIGNQGMSLQAGAVYEGYAIVSAPQGATLAFQFRDRDSSAVLASASVAAPAAPGWQQVNFTLTPSADTTCVGVDFGAEPADMDCGNAGGQVGYVCLRCSGLFVVGLAAAGTANVGFVDVKPGPWGTAAGGVVQKRTADLIQAMGINMIRQGGTVSQTFAWKDWRGPFWQRPAMQHYWAGRLVPVTWGWPEFLQLCENFGIEPVLTFAYDLNQADDWADLVEYLYGNETTQWGALRISDGHPAPYTLRTIELGNEQQNPDFVTQLAALEERRQAIGAPEMFYMYPQNQGVSNTTAQQILALGGTTLAQRVMPDIHVGSGGAVGQATADFEAMPAFPQSAINCEVNAERLDLTRAITEAADHQAFFNLNATMTQRIRGRTASFCTGLSSFYDGFPQELSMAAQNQTWLTAAGQVHAMSAAAFKQAPFGLAVTTGGNGTWLAASAQLSLDRTVMVVQLVNTQNSGEPGQVTISLADASFKPAGTVRTVTLSDPAATPDGSVAPNTFAGNTMATPTYISPVSGSLFWPQGAPSLTVSVPAFTYQILYVYAA